jgi:DNA repair exonuclease SbcCD ATPase subunit
MRFITFKTLVVKNFLSTGNVPICFDIKNGINIITGINLDKEDSKNGVGKSSITDALHFALFGCTIREINKDLIVNSKTKKDCEVQLTFDISHNGITDQYKIIRTLQPTKCFITKNGEDVTRSTLPKTNDFIGKLIHSNSKIFQNSVIMTINSTVPFMAQTKVDKRKFIESILNLEMFSAMLLKARDEYNTQKREYEICFAKHDEIEKSYDFNKQQLELFEDHKKNKIASLQNKIEENMSKIKELEKSFQDIPSNVLDLIDQKNSVLQEELKALRQEHQLQFEKLTEYKTSLKHEKNLLHETGEVHALCSTCGRPFSEDDISHKEEILSKIQKKITQLNSDKESISAVVKELEEKLDSKQEEISTLNIKRNKIQNLIQSNSSLNHKITFLKDSIKDLIAEQTNILKESNDLLEKTVSDLFNELTNHQNQVSKLDRELSVLECVKFVVSEEGVKSYIVRKILKVLNSRLAYYLDQLHANCLCTFNEYFDEHIVDEKGEEKSYFNFSGGERKRIDLACLFAFLDIRRMQGDVHFSTIFYDELLDSSLDDKGVELVLKVLRERQEKYSENCYIITHRGSTILDKADHIITLEKKNGFTYII